MSEGMLSIFHKHPVKTFILAGAGLAGLGAIYSLMYRQSAVKKSLSFQNIKKKSQRIDDLEGLNILIENLEKIISDSTTDDNDTIELLVAILNKLKSARSELRNLFPENNLTKIPRKRVSSRSIGMGKVVVTGSGDSQDTIKEASAIPYYSSNYDPKPGSLSVFSDSDSYQSAVEDFFPPQEDQDFLEEDDMDKGFSSFYNEGLEATKRGEVLFRKNRTDFLKTKDVEDFSAKLYCIRKSCTILMEDESKRLWLTNTGRNILGGILRQDTKDPSDLYDAFDAMMALLKEPKCYENMYEELKLRKIPVINLWDVLLDYIVLDAFEDLRKPPSAFMALVKNPFFSNKTKESSINALIYSLVKAKKIRLTQQYGFISHFYDISLAISPSLAMGLLGISTQEFSDLCTFFKEHVFTLLINMFSLKCVRYTDPTILSEDIWNLLVKHMEIIQNRVTSDLPPQ
uniref:Mitoguardin n=1 Tax=Rhabditophanes sp. KR3021 TaxID=114890 RepID=A0AC35U2D5_9BILA